MIIVCFSLVTKGKTLSRLDTPTNKSGGKVSGVVWSVCVVSRDGWLEVGCGEVGFVSDHMC